MADKRRYLIRMGLGAVICVAAMQLLSPLIEFLSKPEVAQFLVYLETGRVVKLQLDPPIETEPPETEPTASAPRQEPMVLSAADTQLIDIYYHWECRLDTQAMLLSELDWDLTDQGPRVLILHSHATESYTQTPQNRYEESSEYRTLDPAYNMLRVGQALAQALEARGIGVIHDTTLHDHPSYTDAYIRSRETVRQYLERYPSICLVLDLHRDAAEMDGGGQLTTYAQVDGKDSAQIMLVVGSNAGGREHPGWRENMSLALKLHATLEKQNPGICKPMGLRTERFNQDLSSGALLVEIGAAGDTLEDAITAAEALAEGIYALALGATTTASTN